MRKLCFVVCYFGKLPPTMQTTLETCKWNPNYDWFLYTDDKTAYDYPENFHVKYCTFIDLVNEIKKKFDFDISIKSPKKLCDYKPAYGYIFEDELKEYEYWGYCDLDQYFGDLSNFLNGDFLKKYDKIFTLGHMTIFPNNDISRRLFMLNGWYKSFFSTDKGCSFDEFTVNGQSINSIAEVSNLRICNDWPMFDAGPHSSTFIGSQYDLKTHQWTEDDKGSTIVAWADGKLYAYTAGGVERREILYAHIQKRNLTVKHKGICNTFIFYPNIILHGLAINDDEIKLLCRKVKIRSIFKPDEIAWKCQLKKYKLKNYINKIFR